MKIKKNILNSREAFLKFRIVDCGSKLSCRQDNMIKKIWLWNLICFINNWSIIQIDQPLKTRSCDEWTNKQSVDSIIFFFLKENTLINLNTFLPNLSYFGRLWSRDAALFWKRLISFFLLCKNHLENVCFIWGLAHFSISEKNLSGVFKKKNGRMVQIRHMGVVIYNISLF